MSTNAQFTAGQIAAALGVKRQAVQWHLRDVSPGGVCIVAGNETSAWAVEELPAPLRERLAAAATLQRCRTIETLLTMPRQQWQPRDKKTGAVIPLAKISEPDLQRAAKLRSALKPFLTQPRDAGMSVEQWKQTGVELYRRIFGARISTRQWDKLFCRAQERDNGLEDYDALQLYLLERWKLKSEPADIVTEALAVDFSGLENLIATFKNPHALDDLEREALWKLAISQYQSTVAAGEGEKVAARNLRQFIFEKQVFPLVSRDGLLKTFTRKLAAVEAAGGNLSAAGDNRAGNGVHVEIPQTDLDLLANAIVFKSGGRKLTAWRKMYSRLSAETRERYPDRKRLPAKINELLNPEMIRALIARHQGKRTLQRMIGGVKRDWSNIPAMHLWVADDMTSNIKVASDESTRSTFQPQIIAVMDSASRKWVGWTIADAKAPNAGMVCDAIQDGMERTGFVPKNLRLENGFTFGKSLLINGKADERGNIMVAGLAQFGCNVGHFEKMNPQSKSELEYSFHQIQCLMESLPGYSGRLAMLDAPEEFKREEYLIGRGKIKAADRRFTFAEFVGQMNQLVAEYNSTPQGGRLAGESPDSAFNKLLQLGDPPQEYTPAAAWYFDNEKTIVTVKMGGVKFKHRSTGLDISVSGGALVHRIGQELRALVHRRDPSIVTFMSLDYSETFTMEVDQCPSADERSMAPGSQVLATARAKKRAHALAISDEYKRLEKLGNPRKDTLAEIRGQLPSSGEADSETPRRITVFPENMVASAQQMDLQRAEIQTQRKQRRRLQTKAQKLARDTGLNLPVEGMELITPEQASLLRDVMKGEQSI